MASIAASSSDIAARTGVSAGLPSCAIRSSAIASANADIEVRELALDDAGPLSARSATVYPDVKIETSDDGHGGSVTTAKVPDGAKPSRRVAFVRQVEGNPLAVYVVEQSLYSEIYDGYQKRFSKAPQLLAPGQFVTIVSPELYQSFNALFVVAFTPLVVWFFGLLGRKGLKISTAQKVFWGLVLTTASMVLMALAGMMSASIEGAAGLRLFLEAMGSGLATGETRDALGRAFDTMAAEIAARLVPHGYEAKEAQSLARGLLAMADGVILHHGLFAQDADLTTQFRALLSASLVERHARP